jgi:hypothetical protein
MPLPYKEEEVLEEVSSSSATVKVPPGPNDDERAISQKKETEDPVAVVTTIEAGASADSNSNPDDRRAALVVEARERLRLAQAAGLGVPQAEVRAPDLAIVEKILAVFQDGADFRAWVEGTVSSGVVGVGALGVAGGLIGLGPDPLGDRTVDGPGRNGKSGGIDDERTRAREARVGAGSDGVVGIDGTVGQQTAAGGHSGVVDDDGHHAGGWSGGATDLDTQPVGLGEEGSLVTTISRLLMPPTKPLVMENGVRLVKPVTEATDAPLSFITAELSAAHCPASTAVAGLKPVRSKVVW